MEINSVIFLPFRNSTSINILPAIFIDNDDFFEGGLLLQQNVKKVSPHAHLVHLAGKCRVYTAERAFYSEDPLHYLLH